ncbi:hypothetical protein RvY_16119 [Ramazzottius varieornatus]|uniref:FAD-dependent oxidoreductase domain-containing protein 1 n=1 Tax=Ramazzottius varieornatus TaxID=947166 RepID=A0A1D1W3W4_RAMVA|nr:hypothetical protein RvY_16119 [Ramazzottius varieornatus]
MKKAFCVLPSFQNTSPRLRLVCRCQRWYSDDSKKDDTGASRDAARAQMDEAKRLAKESSKQKAPKFDDFGPIYRPTYVPDDPLTADPTKRAIKVLKHQGWELWDAIRGRSPGPGWREARIFPQFCDTLIIGGGIMGSVVAYYLKEKIPEALNIVVVEKDPTYQHAASTNSMGTIRVQFSQPENVKAALYGAEFLRTMKEKLNVYADEPDDVKFNPQGFLFLGTEADVPQMKINHEMQIECGAKVALMTPGRLAARYPWMNLEDIALASYGLEQEGWYDTWKLLYALKKKNLSMGIHYVDGEVIGFENDNQWGDFPEHYISGAGGQKFQRMVRAKVKTHNHGEQRIQFSQAVIAAGHEAAQICELLGIGKPQPGIRVIQCPIEKRKRYIYMFHCPEGPRLSFPILVDPNGLYVRREGINGMYMCSYTPRSNQQEPDPDDPNSGEEFFNNVLWPKLVYRAPVFSKLKLRGSWHTFYDYNYFDQTGIVGPHPYYFNISFACGFSGYGIQHAPAVGHALGELLYEMKYVDIDMTKFEFERFLQYDVVKEVVIV